MSTAASQSNRNIIKKDFYFNLSFSNTKGISLYSKSESHIFNLLHTQCVLVDFYSYIYFFYFRC